MAQFGLVHSHLAPSLCLGRKNSVVAETGRCGLITLWWPEGERGEQKGLGRETSDSTTQKQASSCQAASHISPALSNAT